MKPSFRVNKLQRIAFWRRRIKKGDEVMVVLGVDPGLQCAGYGILKKDKRTTILLDCGYLKMSSRKSLPERVSIFHDFFEEKVSTHKPDILALETPFLGKNTQSFLKLGYLRGILYLITHRNELLIREFAPREVKQAVTGYGAARKEQVSRAVMSLFPNLKLPSNYDVSDALAVTLCGMWKTQILKVR